MPSKTLTAHSLAEMVRWLSETNAMLRALPSDGVPLHLYSAWIDARAHTGMMRDDLLRLSCADVAVEPVAVV
jgi:hypothetical protein